MKTKLLYNNQADIQAAGQIIARGGLVGIPTETVYGLGANALDPKAVRKIFLAKGRPQDNPLIIHISSPEQLAPLVREITVQAKALMDAYWPGPLTIILPKTSLVPRETSGGLDTVAVRLPDHPVARAVIDAAGVPVAAPSANTSGLPSPTTALRVLEDMTGRIDAVLDAGECRVGVESTVVTLATAVPRLLRPGGVTLEQLEAVLGHVDVDEAVFARLQEGGAAASPGMKYKHYAPKADVILIKSGFPAYKRYVEAAADTGVYALCFDGEETALSVPAVTYGDAQADTAQAHNLFNALRRLDDLGAGRVYVRCPHRTGVGMAVYNRLIRAAAYQVIDLDNRLVVGLTGPTGAGKSQVAQQFGKRGFLVIDTDRIAREVTQKGSPVLAQLAQAFGKGILLDGELDRKELARCAFRTKAGQKKLNAITHPAIIARSKEEIENWAKKGYTKFVLDVPLLFESGMDSLCDKTVSVLADRAVRRERILRRDGLTPEQAEQRMQIQNEDAFYQSRSDAVIWNNGGSDAQLAALLDQMENA